MFKVFRLCLYYDLCTLIRKPSQWFHPIIFFVILIALFTIGLSFEQSMLIKISPAIIWVVFLLTSLFSIEAMFRAQEEEGSLPQLIFSPYPLWWLLMAKSLALWIVSCLPLILMMPFAGLFLQFSPWQMLVLTLSLLVSSPALTFIGVLGAALTISLPRSGIFLGLLLLPLYVPILILGESALTSVLSAQWPVFQLSLLGAFSLFAITVIPHASALALKAAMD